MDINVVCSIHSALWVHSLYDHLDIWTHSIHVRVLTMFKASTTLVACATSITLASLIPKLLSMKVREGLLTSKTKELDREVSFMKTQEQQERHIEIALYNS